jgi:hypothetical protein
MPKVDPNKRYEVTDMLSGFPSHTDEHGTVHIDMTGGFPMVPDKIRIPTNPQTEDDIKANHFDRLGVCDHCNHLLPLNVYSTCQDCERLIGACNHD